MTTLALNHLWNYLQSLPMSYKDMVWLRKRIDDAIKEKAPKEAEVPNRLEWLRNHPLELTAEELEDERTQYILGK